MSKTILLIKPTILPLGVEYLKKKYDTVMAPEGSEDTIIRYVNESKASAIVTRGEKITEKILKNCPSLEVVGYPGVGINSIDIPSCTEYGVSVVNAPNGNYVSVAEHAMLFVLSLSRNLVDRDYCVRNDKWHKRDAELPMEIHSKKLFIIGLGKSGREAARMAQAFNMKVMAYSRSISREKMDSVNIEKVESLEEGMAKADFVSLHVPLTEETRGMISREQISCMKKTGFLINISRGPIIDQNALVEALKANRIAGAALDVFDVEPPSLADPILELKNVILTPHLAGDTKEAKERCIMTMVEGMDAVLSGKIPQYIANPEVIKKKTNA